MGLSDWFKKIFNRKDEVIRKEEAEKTEEEVIVVDTSELEKELDKEQEQINLQYVNEGLTDEVLEKQVELNTKRSENNIPDRKELVDGWSQ